MIYLNGDLVKFEIFPNGESKLDRDSLGDSVRMADVNEVIFSYQEDGDLIKLAILKDFLDYLGYKTSIVITYMPYSRMDRNNNGEVAFSLKTISKFINNLNFLEVFVIEPHSDVTTALLERSFKWDISEDLLPKVLLETDFNVEKDYLFFPDAGAQKRYPDIKGFNYLVGHKKRDFKTGEIKSLEVVGDLPDNTKDIKVIIIDDLCSKGGTFWFSGLKLKELGFGEISLLVAHCENSIFEGKLLSYESPVSKIFTTNSIIQTTRSLEWDDDYSDIIKIYKLEELA
jgi:ribose-phosphate pyrophosphokinase